MKNSFPPHWRKWAALGLLIGSCGIWLASRPLTGVKTNTIAASSQLVTDGAPWPASQRGADEPKIKRLPIDPSGMPDRFSKAVVLAQRETKREEGGTQRLQRLKLVRDDSFKYPLLRVEEEALQTPQGEKLVRQRAMVADHVVISPKAGVTDGQLLEQLKPLGAQIRRKMPASGLWLVSFPEASLDTVPKALAEIAQIGGLAKSADPDWVVHAMVTPNDNSFSQLWGLHNTGQNGGTPDADIDAPEAWEMTKGSRDVLIGVIDTGVDYTHPDLAANMWTNPNEIAGNGIDDDGNGYVDDVRGWDFANGDNNPMDDHGHGTHVSGTIGGVGNNGSGVAGVNWQVSIMGLKFLDASGNGATSDATEATAYATHMGVLLTSNSWGGDGYTQSLKDQIDAANNAGILFIAAAGNDGLNSEAIPNYPSGFTSSNIISVASTTRTDQLSDFSNYGATSVDLAAPGSEIYSTTPNNTYAFYNGTSMATPHVSGVCALLKAFKPGLTHTEIRNLILESVDVLPALNGRCTTGGRLNAYSALLASDDITISPAGVFRTSEVLGGLPTPNSQTFTVTNRASHPVTWRAASDQAWATLSAATGTLTAGESATLVLHLNAAAAFLPIGSHTATVTFTNENTSRTQVRTAVLEVIPPLVISEPLDTDPGWPRTGQWAFGTPMGGGALEHGYPDPTAGATGVNVLGVNLNGDYSITPGGPYYVTAGPFDLTNHESCQLGFKRWLNTDEPGWVPVTLEISTNGSTWNTVWTNTATVIDSEWVPVMYDISARADRQASVYVRWGYRVVNTSNIWAYSGWNIDDIQIHGVPIQQLSLNIPEEVNEGQGPVEGTLRINPAPTTDVTVTLSSSNPAQATVPGEVVVPAGATSAAFQISPQDDSMLDGTQQVIISAAAPGYLASKATMAVHDNEQGILTLSLPASVTEGAGLLGNVASVSLQAPAGADVQIHLHSNDPSEVSVPAFVILPAGQTTVAVPLTIPDDGLIDGPQEVTLTASVTNWMGTSATLTMLDNEALTLTLALPVAVIEGQSSASLTGSVRITGVLPNALTVMLASNDPSELTVPHEAIIPAGSTSFSFPLTVVDDAEVDGPQTVEVSAQAAGFITGVRTITVYDNETPAQPANPQPAHLATSVHPDSDLAWSFAASTGGTPTSYEVFMGASPDLGADQLLGTTSSLTWALPRLTPGTTYYWKVIAHLGSVSTSSAVWTFGVPPVGPPTRFAWGVITDPKLVDETFVASVTAYDAFDNISAGYAGAAEVRPVRYDSPILITEVNPNTPDEIEFTNVSAVSVDISGWTVRTYDNDYFPSSLIYTFPAGSICPPGAVFRLQEFGTAPGSFPLFFTGLNINWTSEQLTRLAVLLQKGDGKMVDFMCAGSGTASSISVPAAIPASQWSGGTIPAPTDATFGYARQGSSDTNTAVNWSRIAPGVGTLNPGLVIPFDNPSLPIPVEPSSITFMAGQWSGIMRVRAPGESIQLQARDDATHQGDSNAFSVLSLGPLTLTSTVTRVDEGSAPISNALTIKLPTTSAQEVSVTLASNREADIPTTTFAIPSGQLSATVPLTAGDDALLNGSRSVLLEARANGYQSSQLALMVDDNETATLSLTAPATVTEGAGVLVRQGTVTVSQPPDADVTVSLQSSDPTEVIVPATVVIAAGTTSGNFDLEVPQDQLIDGTQTVTLTATVRHWTSGSHTMMVLDDEVKGVSLTLNGPLDEGAGLVSAGGTVTLSGVPVDDVTVHLTSDSSKLTVPESVKVLAGTSSVSFPVTVNDNAILDGTQTATVSAAAWDLPAVTKTVSIRDNDAASFVLSTVASPQREGIPFAFTATARDVNGEILHQVGGGVTLTAAGDDGALLITPMTMPAFANGTSAAMLAIQPPGTGVKITVTGAHASSRSNAFVVQLGARMEVSPPSLAATVAQEAVQTRTLTVRNTGLDPLTWSATSASVSVLQRSPDFVGSAEFSASAQKEPPELAATTFSVRPDAGHYESSGLEATPVHAQAIAEPALDQVLARLQTGSAQVAQVIPNLYPFSEGVSGKSISDGGDDMYDSGNFIATSISTVANFNYSDNVIASSLQLGTGGKYFTRKTTGLFVFAADMAEVNSFQITGNLGADGSGAVNGTVLSATYRGASYKGFVKRVYNAGDPSVNHLIIVRDTPGLGHDFSTSTDDDYHRVTGLGSSSRIYYLLYAGAGGSYINDSQTAAIFSKFLEVIGAGDWLTAQPSSGTVVPGGSTDVVVTMNPGKMTPGTYQATLALTSNDPIHSPVNVPVSMTVTEGIRKLAWSQIPTTQYVNKPFPVTVTAQDSQGNTVNGFNGTVSLSAKPGAVAPKVNILTYVGTADLSNEYARTKQAISTYFSNFSETSTSTSSATTLATQLAGKQVFLVVEQELVTSMASLATAWASVLNNFVQSGGTIIVCSYAKDEHLLLQTSGLMDVSKVQSMTSSTLIKPAATYLNTGVETPFIVGYTAGYASGNATVSLRDQVTGHAVVLHRDLGAGRVILIGTDYDSIGTGMDRVIANAVASAVSAPGSVAVTPTVSAPFVNGVWNGEMQVKQLVPNVTLHAEYSLGVEGYSNMLAIQSLMNLHLAVPALVTEGQGLISGVGQVSVATAPTSDLVVSLFSADSNQISVPTSTVILAGTTSASFGVTVHDDSLLNGMRNVAIQAEAPGAALTTSPVLIRDNETATLTVNLPSAPLESQGALTNQGTVSVNAVPAVDFTVELTSSDVSELTVPATVVIPAGTTSATFTPVMVDDDLLDGPQTVTVTAHVYGWTDGVKVMTVNDNELATITVQLSQSSVPESFGILTGTATLGGVAVTDRLLNLSSSLPNDATVPPTATVLAGTNKVTFDVTVVDDDLAELDETAIIGASGVGLTVGSADLVIRDNDPHHFAFDAITGPRIKGVEFPVAIRALNPNNALLSDFGGNVALSASAEGPSLPISPSGSSGFNSGLWAGNVAVNVEGSGVQLTAARLGAFGNSMAFDVRDPSGDNDHNGVSNLMEYAFGMSSSGAATVPYQSASAVNPADGLRYMTLSFRRRVAASNLQYIVETSDTLGSWTAATTGYQVISVTPNGDGITETVSVRILPALGTAGVPAKFARVRLLVP